MLKPLALLLTLAACIQPGLPRPQAQDRIILSERGNINAGHSLIVTPDDRVVYDAYGTDIAPQTPGWQWQDTTRMTGQASVTAPGAYMRALRLLNRADLPDASSSSQPPCPNAGQSTMVLANASGTLRNFVIDTCRQDDPNTAYANAFFTLQSALRGAILPANWLSR